MKKPSWLVAGCLVSLCCSSFAFAASKSESVLPAKTTEIAQHYGGNEKTDAFIQKMVSEHGFERQYLINQLTDATRQQKILDAIARPAEKTLEWYEYRKIFLTDSRIEKGLAFWREHEKALARAEQTYGVPASMIVAIIGVETFYGKWRGKYRVLDALSTLAFDYPPRSKFFTKQLEEYFLMAREQKLDPAALKGSYAGAMGYGQFIPSSYRAYAVDFDDDGVADIVNNPVDAIGSVANYFKRHGWKKGETVVVTASIADQSDKSVFNTSLKPTLTVAELKSKGVLAGEDVAMNESVSPMLLKTAEGEEYWLGLKNFYVITRYNHSRMYAMAVHQLSQAISEQR